MITQKNDNNKTWYLVDASKKSLGRFSTEVAKILIGKDKVNYLPNKDVGDYVVIINSSNLKLSKNKEISKRYYKHTKYIGNLKTKRYLEIKKDNPNYLIYHSISGMLPKNLLGKKIIRRLKIYKSEDHPHNNVKLINLYD